MGSLLRYAHIRAAARLHSSPASYLTPSRSSLRAPSRIIRPLAYSTSAASSTSSSSSSTHSSTSSSSSAVRNKTLFHRYQESSKKRPYLTQIWTFLCLWFVGDVGAQLFFPAQIEDEDGSGRLKSKPYDPWQTLRHLFIAATVAVPTNSWFMVIGRSFNYTNKLLSLVIKVAVQQVVYTPVFNTYFFTMHSLLSGASWDQTVKHLRLALPKSIKNGIAVWTAAAVVNFTVIPLVLQGPFMGMTAVGWQIYLSWMNQTLAQKKAAKAVTLG